MRSHTVFVSSLLALAVWPQLLKGAEETVFVRSDPAGASVYIDVQKKEAGKTPFIVEVPKGRHRLNLRLEGYQDATIDVVVRGKVIQRPDVIHLIALPNATAKIDNTSSVDGESGGISIRYIELQMDANGMGSLHVDCRTNSNAVIALREGLPSKLGLFDGAHVVRLGDGQTEVLHDFASLASVEDLVHETPNKDAFALDKVREGLILRPAEMPGYRNKVAQFWYPRPVRLPVTLRMAVADLETDPFCIELQFQQKRYAKLNVYFFTNAKRPLGVLVSWFDAEKGSLANLIDSDLPVNGDVTYKFICPVDDEHQIPTPFFQRITSEMTLRQLDVTTRFPARLGMKFSERKGQVFVESVLEGPASKAGVKPGDVVLRINSQSITSAEAAVRITRECKVGDTLSLSISREGNALSLPVIAE